MKSLTMLLLLTVILSGCMEFNRAKDPKFNKGEYVIIRITGEKGMIKDSLCSVQSCTYFVRVPSLVILRFEEEEIQEYTEQTGAIQ